MNSLIVVAVTLFAIVAVVLGLVWVFQERIAFQPQAGPYPDERGIRRVEYKAEDGQRLFAYIIGTPSPARGMVIAFHGNADLAIRQVDWANEVASRTGVSVLLPEYRGYMGLGGRPSYEGSRKDAEAVYRFARETLRMPDERLAYFGHSLGTAIAAELAVRHPPAALLLQSPFTSAKDMAGLMIGRRPAEASWPLVSRLHFDTGALVASLEVPVHVCHGADDRLIPTWMGNKVFESAKSKGALLIVPGASHNDVELTGGEAYWSWVVSALRPLVSQASEQ